MKTLKHFLLDAYWAYDSIAEAEGLSPVLRSARSSGRH